MKKKVAEPKYVAVQDGDFITYGRDLNDLRKNLTDDSRACDVSVDDPLEFGLYKFVGMVQLEKPPTSLKVTFPKGA